MRLDPLLSPKSIALVRASGRPRSFGHEQMIFVYADPTGKRRCKHVRREDEPRFETGMVRYHGFRAAIKELKHLNEEELTLLRAYASSRALVYTKDKN